MLSTNSSPEAFAVGHQQCPFRVISRSSCRILNVVTPGVWSRWVSYAARHAHMHPVRLGRSLSNQSPSRILLAHWCHVGACSVEHHVAFRNKPFIPSWQWERCAIVCPVLGQHKKLHAVQRGGLFSSLFHYVIELLCLAERIPINFQRHDIFTCLLQFTLGLLAS